MHAQQPGLSQTPRPTPQMPSHCEFGPPKVHWGGVAARRSGQMNGVQGAWPGAVICPPKRHPAVHASNFKLPDS